MSKIMSECLVDVWKRTLFLKALIFGVHIHTLKPQSPIRNHE